MKRYVLKNKDGKYYQPSEGRGIYNNFVDSIEDAYWYKTEQSSLSPVKQHRLNVSVVELDITISTKALSTHENLLKESEQLVKEWEAMTPEEAEALSQAKYNRYKKARAYMRIHG
jgi:hypothetical protein